MKKGALLMQSPIYFASLCFLNALLFFNLNSPDAFPEHAALVSLVRTSGGNVAPCSVNDRQLLCQSLVGCVDVRQL